jgi:hypothetical protein
MKSRRRTESIACRRWLHTRTLAYAGAGLIGFLAAPQVAQANSITADLRALTGYHTYITALSGDARASAARDGQIVAGVEANCPNALTDLNNLSSDQLKQSALSDFGNEIDADLATAYLAPTRPALNAFGSSLTGLKWSGTNQTTTTSQLISTERKLLNVPESDLCGDASQLDAAPLDEPTGTTSFLMHYRTASRNESAALKAFQTLLSKYEISSEDKLVSQINTLVSQFSSQSGSTEQADASAILSDLGVSQS